MNQSEAKCPCERGIKGRIGRREKKGLFLALALVCRLRSRALPWAKCSVQFPTPFNPIINEYAQQRKIPAKPPFRIDSFPIEHRAPEKRELYRVPIACAAPWWEYSVCMRLGVYGRAFLP